MKNDLFLENFDKKELIFLKNLGLEVKYAKKYFFFNYLTSASNTGFSDQTITKILQKARNFDIFYLKSRNNERSFFI